MTEENKTQKKGDNGVVFTGEGIALYRLLTIRAGIMSEMRGMRLTNKARTCYSIAKSEFGLKGNREKVLKQLEAIIEEKKRTLPPDSIKQI